MSYLEEKDTSYKLAIVGAIAMGVTLVISMLVFCFVYYVYNPHNSFGINIINVLLPIRCLLYFLDRS